MMTINPVLFYLKGGDLMRLTVKQEKYAQATEGLKLKAQLRFNKELLTKIDGIKVTAQENRGIVYGLLNGFLPKHEQVDVMQAVKIYRIYRIKKANEGMSVEDAVKAYEDKGYNEKVIRPEESRMT